MKKILDGKIVYRIDINKSIDIESKKKLENNCLQFSNSLDAPEVNCCCDSKEKTFSEDSKLFSTFIEDSSFTDDLSIILQKKNSIKENLNNKKTPPTTPQLKVKDETIEYLKEEQKNSKFSTPKLQEYNKQFYNTNDDDANSTFKPIINGISYQIGEIQENKRLKDIALETLFKNYSLKKWYRKNENNRQMILKNYKNTYISSPLSRNNTNQRMEVIELTALQIDFVQKIITTLEKGKKISINDSLYLDSLNRLITKLYKTMNAIISIRKKFITSTKMKINDNIDNEYFKQNKKIDNIDKKLDQSINSINIHTSWQEKIKSYCFSDGAVEKLFDSNINKLNTSRNELIK